MILVKAAEVRARLSRRVIDPCRLGPCARPRPLFVPPPRAIILDLDKTLYPYDPAFMAACRKALRHLILDRKIGLSPAQVQDYTAVDYPMPCIARLSREFGLDIPDLFFGYFTRLDESFLHPNKAFLAQARHAASLHTTFGLLSHGNRSWVNRALRKLELEEMIPPRHRVTIEDMPHGDKDSGPRPLQALLDRMDVPASNVCVVDDKDKNLGPARALGCLTILVTHANPDPSMTRIHAAHVYDYAHEFLADVNHAHRRPPLRLLAS